MGEKRVQNHVIMTDLNKTHVQQIKEALCGKYSCTLETNSVNLYAFCTGL